MAYNLLTLPSELLGSLTSYLGAVSIYRLFLCGAKSFNYKLTSASGARELRFGYVGGAKSDLTQSLFGLTHLFPHLRHFSFSYFSSVYSSYNSIRLPMTITSIQIACNNAELLFSQAPFLPLKTTLPALEHLLLSGRGITWSREVISTLPPCLKSLSLQSNNALKNFSHLLPRGLTLLSLPYNQLINDLEFRDMPTGLTSLNLHGAALTHLPKTFATLPLTSLTLTSNPSTNWRGFDNLPHTLKIMNVPGTFTVSDIKSLPNGLEEFRFGYSWNMDEHILGALPRGLKRLTLSPRVSDETLRNLPPKLESLTLGYSTKPCRTAIEAFPSTLTILHMEHMSAIADEHFELLPKGLTSLSMASQKASKRAILGLPPKLRRLTFSNYDNATNGLPIHCICLLPKSLVSADIGQCAVTDECIEFLAQTYPEFWHGVQTFELTKAASLFAQASGLHMGMFKNAQITFFSSLTEKFLDLLPRGLKTLRLNTGRLWGNSLIPRLPQGLTELSLSSTALTDECVPQIPQSLTKLDISQVDGLSDDALAGLPPGLTQVAIGAVNFRKHTLMTLKDHQGVLNNNILKGAFLKNHAQRTFDGLRLDAAWRDCFDDEDLQLIPRDIHTVKISANTISDTGIAHLPPGLTELKLEKAEIFTARGVKALPRGLRSLSLPWCASLYDEDLDFLPTALTKLELPWGKELSDECIAKLPRELTDLDLSSTPLTDACVPQMPPKLTKLAVQWSKLSSACTKQLPRTLIELDLGESRRFLNNLDVNDLPPHLSVVKWEWNEKNINACLTRFPNLVIPQSALVKLNLILVAPYHKHLISGAK